MKFNLPFKAFIVSIMLLGVAILAAACGVQTPALPVQGAATAGPVATDAPIETTVEWDAQPEQAETEPTPGVAHAGPVTYIGKDGNIWVMDAPDGEQRQLTADAVNPSPETSTAVQYYSPALSSDGRLVAYRRDAGTSAGDGFRYQFGLWVHDLTSGESRQVLEGIPAGFAWKPGTHVLAYGQGVAEGYFAARGQVDPALATGIWALDMDQATLEPVELVKPTRGYTLVSPTWSPDGRFLAFDEVHMYEGRGMFAYYDLSNQEYSAWETPIGNYAWSPDGEMIFYDMQTYTVNGEERIFTRERLGAKEQRQVAPQDESAFAFYPALSPQGDRIAYLSGTDMPDTGPYTLMVQTLSSGETVELGQYEGVLGLTWTPDGQSLIFSAGPYDGQQVFLMNATDGAVTILADGSDPSLPAR